MNLLKAVELNKESIIELKKEKFHDHADAVRLGNEAIERLIHARSFNHDWAKMPLAYENRD